LFDMHGNVAEWCLERGDRRIAGPPNATSCVVRGGGFLGTGSSLRSAASVLQPMNVPRIDLGLRVLLTIAPSSLGGARPNVSAPPPAPTPVAPPTRVGPAPPPAVAPFDAAQAKAHQEAWAKHLGQPVEVTNSIGMRLVLIPPGKFVIGSPPNQAMHTSAEKQADVEISRPSRLGMHEVTRGQFRTVMGSEPWKTKQGVPQDIPDGDDYAAFRVTWNEAAEFCRRLTETERSARTLAADEDYRLPTEAEWEHACRAGTTSIYSFGNVGIRLVDYAWCEANRSPPNAYCPNRVGRKGPNPWQLHDMHGNVNEWCADLFAATPPGGVDPLGSPIHPAYDARVYRGGSALESHANCRSAFRQGQSPRNRDLYGFRVLRTISLP
jgi:formylglycine-generating enzyme required for sulfatase activity